MQHHLPRGGDSNPGGHIPRPISILRCKVLTGTKVPSPSGGTRGYRYQCSAFYREVAIPGGHILDPRFRMTRCGKAVYVG